MDWVAGEGGDGEVFLQEPFNSRLLANEDGTHRQGCREGAGSSTSINGLTVFLAGTSPSILPAAFNFLSIACSIFFFFWLS